VAEYNSNVKMPPERNVAGSAESEHPVLPKFPSMAQSTSCRPRLALIAWLLVTVAIALLAGLMVHWVNRRMAEASERQRIEQNAAQIVEIVEKNELVYQLPMHDAGFVEQIMQEPACAALIKGVAIWADDLEDPKWSLLARFPNLKAIMIYEGKPEPLLASLRGKVRLEKLSLSKVPVTPTTMQFVASCPSLKKLHLFTARWEASPEPLRGHPAIETLWLEGFHLDAEWVEVLQTLPELRELDLKGSQLDARAIQDLKKALPRCNVGE
jgi:hypothetical protein